MKTTLDLDDRLIGDARALAVRQRTTLTRLVEEGLRLRLRATAEPVEPQRVSLPVFHGRGGLAAGVDPSSNKALFKAVNENA